MSDTTSTPAPQPAPSSTPAPTPPIFWNGQPWTPDLASARRTELLADSKYCEAARNGDAAKQTELSQLYLIERGIAPSPPPESVDDVEIRVLDRAAREQAIHAETLKQTADFTPEQIHQITNGRPIPAEEKRIAERRLAALQKDKGFVERYLNGDREARTQMAAAAIAARGLPTAKNLAEIEDWQKRFPSPVPK
jgi:hypothetical protein